MGNFYCNLSVLGPSTEDVLTALRNRKRRAYVAPARNGVTVVYDQWCDSLHTDAVDWLGEALSSDFSAPVLAALNADDDVLLLALYQSGKKSVSYMSKGSVGGAFRLCRAFGRPLVAPLLAFVLVWPVFLFEVLRHKAVASLLGLPPWSVGFGYGYLARGELPDGLGEEQLLES